MFRFKFNTEDAFKVHNKLNCAMSTFSLEIELSRQRKLA